MRQYSLTDVGEEGIRKLEKALTEKGLSASIAHLFWLPVPDSLLTALQKEHANTCGPHVLALETNRTGLSLELLVRARNKLRCDCIGWASQSLRST